MKKYVFTKSMKRYERCKLCKKLYDEVIETKLNTALGKLESQISEKKKKSLYGNKQIGNIYAHGKFNHKGIDIYIIMGESKGADIVFNTSPIDASFVEYVRIASTGKTILYTQHLFDRYNERIFNKSIGSHKEMMIEFFKNNQTKPPMTMEDNNIVQRIDEGFVLGTVDKENDCVILNTFYDNQEAKDNHIKSDARRIKTEMEKLSSKDMEAYDYLGYQLQKGEISEEDYYFLTNYLFYNSK